ncbi:amidohydrolase [Colletotrichum sojae]|uniref:Amidohydrolase n=1 Tax=Colletotrichum sojae TaxID=2175907 RepID=A0A8H6MV39_9PEZI|nr:amidohydrolase [Colletotrichum sojae]
MDPEKSGLPPYSDVPSSHRHSHPHPHANSKRWLRPSRSMKLIVLCLGFIAFAQWRQLELLPTSKPSSNLSAARLQQDLATCAKLRHKPQDPIGLGREKNARYVEGTRPTLIRNATVWVGEAVEGTSPEDDRAGKGYSWITADVLVDQGLIQKVEAVISLDSLPKDTQIWDAKGRQLTSGIIDMHSHAGVDSLPELNGNQDTNEMSSDITPYVRSIDGINPFDHQIQVIKSGGVTTSLVLPGSGNNIGGEAYVIKHAVGKKDGRTEVSAEDMLADPDRNWRYMKMACGENAKRVYGKVGHSPFSRLGESWEFRHAFEQAANLIREQDDWCDAAEKNGVETLTKYLPQELKWESLSAALRGQVHINTHCYTVPDLEAFVDHTNEFKFPVRAFHHAHQTFLVPEILKRTWGGRPPASALFADNMYYKAESYIASEYAGKILWENGLTPVYVSDNPVLNAQHVLFEAAKAYKYGLLYHVALASVTSAPAELLGLGQRIGKIKPGFDADIAVWDSDPLSVGAAPVQVWIDGAAQFSDPFELNKPLTGPISPDPELAKTREETTDLNDVVFTGVVKVLLSGEEERPASDEPFNVVVSGGTIKCVGTCSEEVAAAKSSSKKIIDLKNGHVTESFTAFGSTIGLNEIDAEADTDNGRSPGFSRGIDGLVLDNKKLHVAHRYGVTKAISAPKFSGQATHSGTSVGFNTGALHAFEKGAVWGEDVALHRTLSLAAKRGENPSLSGVIGSLRHTLLEAVASNDTGSDPFSEAAHLKKVVNGELPLVLTVHSADAIVAALRVKSEVEEALAAKSQPAKSPKIKVAIIGGAESHLVAKELAAADVGVVLAPFEPYSSTWDQRRSLTGAPLTNGTAVDVLVDAGVVLAVGLEEDWRIRDLGLAAGIAHKNGGGRLSEKKALDLVSNNVYKILGLEEPQARKAGHFIVYEGNPLEIEGRVRAVGSGRETVAVFDRKYTSRYFSAQPTTTMTRAAVVCVSHGGGPMPVLGDPGHASITASLKERVPKILKLNTPDAPRAIVVVTAHWSEGRPTISSAGSHDLYYDYGGFPREAYSLEYPAPGSPSIAEELKQALEKEGLSPVLNSRRGWDHGVFIPMLLVNPAANIPIIQLSVLASEDAEEHLRMGRALSTLRDSNVAILGSGFASLHNFSKMRSLFMGDPSAGAKLGKQVGEWNAELTDAVAKEKLEDRTQALAGWRKFAHSYDMHPRGGGEHFMPLLVCAGAAGDEAVGIYKDDFHGVDINTYYWGDVRV